MWDLIVNLTQYRILLMLSAARCIQIDNWLTLEEHARLLHYVFEQEAKFVPSDMIDGEVEHRKSLLLLSFPEFSDLIETRIQKIFPDLLVQLGLPSLQLSRFETQLNAHNDGNFFKPHTDNAIYDRGTYKDKAVKSRLLTYVYYFYQEPKAFSGGNLRLYDSTIRDHDYVAADSFQTVEPRNNSIVFFLSRYFHEVLPVSCPSQAFTDSRFTINGWIRCFRSAGGHSTTISNKFASLCQTPSDINEHLPVLRDLSKGLDCVEFGVRGVVSTWAMLAAPCKSLISVDINPCPIEEAKIAATNANIPFEFICASTLDIQINPCDLLFIDTLHTYAQLKHELLVHGNQATQYLVFHDTITFGMAGEDGGLGLMPAIEEFIAANPHWKVHAHYTNNNGLLILRRDR